MSNGQTAEQQLNQDVQMNGDGNDNVDTGAAEAPGKDDDRKLFVGGLSWETSDKELRDHFGSYGTIDSINVKTDPNTGRSRGFAFIVFKEASSIDKVLAAGDHVINNKKIDPKKAKARHGKIFVGGLSSDLSDDDIKNYFNQFGSIVDVEMPYDKQKSQRKGFCFITFESEQIVSELLKTPKQNINGKEVDVKKATPKPDGMASIRGMRGMRGVREHAGGLSSQYSSTGPSGGYGPGAYGPGYGGYGYGSGYDYYGNGYGSGYGSGYGYDAYGYGSYGYDGYGSYGSGYDGGYGAGGGGGRGGRGGKGKGSGGYGKQRGGGRGGARHAPY